MSIITGRQGPRSAAQETTQMTAVVEKLSLDYLVDERRKVLYHEYGGNSESGPKLSNIMEIRKQVLGESTYFFLGNQRFYQSLSHA